MGRVLGAGIIGCGGIATAHAEAYRRSSRARLVAVCDIRRERAVAMAERFGVPRYYTSLEEFLRDPELEVVSICTPHHLHASQTIAAAEAGKHVLCEKPMAISLRQADEMIAACRDNGVKLGIVFQLRFNPLYRRIKEASDGGGFGIPVLAEAMVKWYREEAGYYFRDEVAKSWRGKRATEGGGALINQAIHTIDLLQWIMGPVDFLYGICDTRTHHIEVEDLAVSILRFRSGALGYIVGSVSIKPQETCLNIYGSEGAVCVRDGRITVWTVKDVKPPSGEEMKTSLTGHNAVVEDFLSAIVEDREPMVTGEEGRKSLEIVLAIYRASMKEGKVVFPLAE